MDPGEKSIGRSGKSRDKDNAPFEALGKEAQRARRFAEKAGGYPPTRVFLKKRLDLLDCKGVDFFGSAKEAASCRK
jgi:hypothetical protein